MSMEGVSGGQTKEQVSGWTVDTLHAHLVSLFNEREKAVDQLLKERDNRYMAKFEAAQVAVDKAEENTRQWKQTANEWRGTMQDKDKLQMARPEITSELNSLRVSVSTIRSLSLSAILVCCAVITVVLLLVRPHVA